jgi:hypothetical protein
MRMYGARSLQSAVRMVRSGSVHELRAGSRGNRQLAGRRAQRQLVRAASRSEKSIELRKDCHVSGLTRDEHLAWCKKRALEYLDRGDLEQAFTSMASDLSKHDELRKIGDLMGPVGMLYLMNHDARQLRHWIEGFN